MQLIRKLKEYSRSGIYPFHMPGHKRRLANDELLGQIYDIDITEIEGFDDLHDPRGIIKEAQERAAACFGADETLFLVNGSTGGILAAICGSVTTGDSIVFAANCHRSVYNAVMLCGAKMVMITPESESYYDIAGGIGADAVKDALERAGNGRAAVVITSPTYEGITSDVKSIAEECHKRGAVLIVDAAHGAHFGFSDAYPESPTGYADVVITSVHKTLPAMTQTSLMHIKKDCPSRDRIKRMLSVFMTSSPSYVLMSSIDSMVRLLDEQKGQLFAEHEKRLDALYELAESFECLSVLSREKLTAKGSFDHDRSKILVSDMTSSYTGRQLSDLLLEKFGICAEMAAQTYVLLITGIADTDEGFDRLMQALGDIDKMISGRQASPAKRGVLKRLWDKIIGRRIASKMQSVLPEEGTAGNDAGIRVCDNDIKPVLFEDNVEYVPVELSEGRTAAEFVSVYPPGIPLTVPGVRIDGAAADRILEAMKNGLNVKGLNDGEIAVLWERSSI